MQIKNAHSTPLGLPGGTVIAAGQTATVPDWAEVKKNAVVKAWLSKGVLVEHDKGSDSNDDKAEKEAVVAKLEAADVKFDKRSSLEKLKELLAAHEKGTDSNEGS